MAIPPATPAAVPAAAAALLGDLESPMVDATDGSSSIPVSSPDVYSVGESCTPDDESIASSSSFRLSSAAPPPATTPAATPIPAASPADIPSSSTGALRDAAAVGADFCGGVSSAKDGWLADSDTSLGSIDSEPLLDLSSESSHPSSLSSDEPDICGESEYSEPDSDDE